MANVPFIRGGSYGIPPHPFVLDQITTYGVSVDADMGALQALVDTTLNAAPSGFRFAVISPQVLFSFMRMGCLRSEPAPNVGFYQETELNVTLMLAGWSQQIPVPRIYWYMPYLWIDTPTPQLAGRDIFGYPKLLGKIDMPAGEGAPAEFCVSGEVIHPQSFGTCAEMRPVFRARRTDAGTPGPIEAGQLSLDADSALGILLERVVDLNLGGLGGAAGMLAHAMGLDRLLKLVFLRQFPSIEDENSACYQSIASTTFNITNFHRAGLLAGNYEIEIPQNDSLNLASRLGIGGGAPGDVTVPAKTAYFMDFDMRLNRGTELWVAS